MARTSGRSEEMQRIAIPSSASSRTIAWTSAFAPTSIPRVGSSRRKILGRVFSHLPNITFCWLPPESFSTRCIAEGALMSSRCRNPSAASSSRERWMRPSRERYRRSTGRVTFAAIESGMARPSLRRSSVM